MPTLLLYFFDSLLLHLMNAISESDIRRACLPAPDPLKSASGSIRSGQPPMSVAEILAELERIADLPLSRS